MPVGLVDMDSMGDVLPISKWSEGSGGAPFIDAAYGTFGGRGHRYSGSGMQARRDIPQTTRSIIGFHINIQPPATSGGQIWFRENATTHVIVTFFGDANQVIVKHGDGTILGSSDIQAYPRSVWFYCEIEVLVDNVVGVVRVWLFGSSITVIDVTGVDTRNGASGFINNIKFIGSHSHTHGGDGTVYFDDLYVVDANVLPAKLGACRVTSRFPNSDGTPLEWDPSSGSTHFNLVDEQPFSGTDYVQTNVNGERDMFGITDDGISFGIHGVRVIGQMRKNDVLPAQARLLVKDGANFGSGDVRNLSDTSQVFSDVFGERPAGGGTWSEASVDALQIGVEKVT